MKKFIELHRADFDKEDRPGMYNINYMIDIQPLDSESEEGNVEIQWRDGQWVSYWETYDEVRHMIATCQGGMPVHPWGESK